MSSPSRSEDQQPTVLVLEDEEGLAELYTRWLSEEYSVRTAYTASEAREKFDEAVDVALIDRRLPDGSGDEVLDWISKRQPQCRRAMITAVSPDVDIVEMPVDDYLVKSIDRDELLETVHRLESQRAYDEAVRNLYALTTKRAHLEAELSEAERIDNEEFSRLESEIAELEQRVMEANGNLDDEDLLGIVGRLGDDTRGGWSDGYGEREVSREEYERIETERVSLWYHPTTETYLAVHGWETNESLSTTLVTAVGAIRDTDHDELPVLFETVDPDALDRIFEPTGFGGQRRESGRITVPYSGLLVTIHADGEIVFRPQQRASER